MVFRLLSTLLFTLLFSFSAKAISEFEWYDLTHLRQSRIDLIKQVYEEKEAGGLWFNKGKIVLKGVFLHDIPPYSKVNQFNFRAKKIISLPGTGQVYQFDTSTNELERLDKTFFRGYNFHALQFVKNDTLFSLGGEGFWRSNSILSFFDFKRKEWEQIKTFGDVPQGILSLHAGTVPNQTKVIALEAFQQGDFQATHVGFYELDLVSYVWKRNGKVDLLALKKLGQSTANFIMLGNLMFLNDRQLGLFVDSESNLIYKYMGPKKQFFLMETELFLRGDQILSKQYDKNRPGDQFKIDSMSIDELKKHAQLIGKFYDKEPLFTPYVYLLIGISVCLLISLFVNVWFLFNKKVRSNSSGLPNMPFGGMEFVELYKVNGEEYLVGTEEISLLLGCEKKAFDTQRQYRAQFINAMNQYFADNYQIEEAIFRKADDGDKRFIKYGLKKSVFNNL
jgi:hypothetical protein